MPVTLGGLAAGVVASPPSSSRPVESAAMQLPTYTPRERLWLWMLAILGASVLNGTFLYATAVRPGLMFDALGNPVSAVFLVESLLLTGTLAYLLPKWQVTRIGWIWFVILALMGSLAFALPLALLWPGRREPARP